MQTEPGTAPGPAARSAGVDLARGLAVLFMIQTHALDGWVAQPDKATLAYRLTRVLSNVPAPLFLLLAGVGLAMGARAAAKKGTPPAAVRARLARRGAQVLGYGYLVSLCYAILEGRFDPAALLRADILHCIGLSLVLCAVALVGRTRVGLRTAGVVAAALLGALVAPRLGLGPERLAALPVALKVPLALFWDVAPYTRFPLLPLCTFTAVGFYIGTRLAERLPQPRTSLLLGLLAVALVPLWQHLTALTLAALGGKLSRMHPAVLWNLAEGTSRALAVLFLSLWLADLLAARTPPREPPGWLLRLGRGSLLAYAVHVPLCYGRLAGPVAGRLAMPAAVALLLLLCAFTYAVVRARDALRTRRRA